MTQTRALLFYKHVEDEGTSPLTFDNARLTNTVGSVFDMVVSAVRASEGGEAPKRSEKPSVSYDFYDWNLEAVPDNSTVSCLAKPGIVLAIKKRKEDTHIAAAILKLQLERVTDRMQRDLLDAFLKGPKGQFEPTNIGDMLSDAIEAKPGAFGFSLDLKEVFRNIFRRRRAGK